MLITKYDLEDSFIDERETSDIDREEDEDDHYLDRVENLRHGLEMEDYYSDERETSDIDREEEGDDYYLDHVENLRHELDDENSMREDSPENPWPSRTGRRPSNHILISSDDDNSVSFPDVALEDDNDTVNKDYEENDVYEIDDHNQSAYTRGSEHESEDCSQHSMDNKAHSETMDQDSLGFHEFCDEEEEDQENDNVQDDSESSVRLRNQSKSRVLQHVPTARRVNRIYLDSDDE